MCSFAGIGRCGICGGGDGRQLDSGEYLREVELRGSVSGRDYHHPGDQITIYYDPACPDRARAEFRDPAEGMSLSLVVMIVVGIVLCGMGAIASA